MKTTSARKLYESASIDYGEATPWGDLPEETRKYWEAFYNRNRETAKKEKLDEYEN